MAREADGREVAGHAEGAVVAVCRDATHRFAKPAVDVIRLIAGEGVEGDAHAGVTVKHRSRVARDPTQPNLRQVHLVHEELFEQLAGQGFALAPGRIGENVTTRGVDLLALPAGARLHLGGSAVVEVTGLRNPCGQLDGVAAGLMDAMRPRGADGSVVRLAGVMAVVIAGGEVRVGDPIRVDRPAGAPRPLEVV